MTTLAPYRSELHTGRDGFAQLLRAEWTKFRTVRGWVIGMIVAAAAHRGPRRAHRREQRVRHPDERQQPQPGLSGAADRAGRGVGDRQLLLRPPAAGGERQHHRPGDVADRSVLHPRRDRRRRRLADGGHDSRRAAVVQGRDHHQGEHPPGSGVRGDDGHRKPRRADAVGLHPRRGRPGREGVRGLAALAPADPLRRHDHRLRLGRRQRTGPGSARPRWPGCRPPPRPGCSPPRPGTR